MHKPILNLIKNSPFENPDKIDATRAEVGLGTLAEYKSHFINMCTEDQR